MSQLSLKTTYFLSLLLWLLGACQPQFYGPIKPDLVSDIGRFPLTTIVAGKHIVLPITVENIPELSRNHINNSVGEAGACHLLVQMIDLNGKKISSEMKLSVPPLKPGAKEILEIVIVLPEAGVYEFNTVVDIDNEVDERDETNNGTPWKDTRGKRTMQQQQRLKIEVLCGK